MDLVEFYGRETLPMGQVISATIKTILARVMRSINQEKEVLNIWTRSLVNKIDNLKFLGYIGSDGFPILLPVIQTQAINSSELVFSTSCYGDEIRGIPPGVPMAVFGMSFDMEDVLLRGTYQGIRRIRGFNCGLVEINWVYNSMPPQPQQIYPPTPIQAVNEF